MPVFHVYLNGRKLSTAGVGEDGVVTALVTWVRRTVEDTRSRKADSVEEALTLEVGGLVRPSKEHVDWVDRKLKVGDEVTIRVAQDGKVDQPCSRRTYEDSKELRLQKRYVREMAKKFGWRI